MSVNKKIPYFHWLKDTFFSGPFAFKTQSLTLNITHYNLHGTAVLQFWISTGCLTGMGKDHSNIRTITPTNTSHIFYYKTHNIVYQGHKPLLWSEAVCNWPQIDPKSEETSQIPKTRAINDSIHDLTQTSARKHLAFSQNTGWLQHSLIIRMQTYHKSSAITNGENICSYYRYVVTESVCQVTWVIHVYIYIYVCVYVCVCMYVCMYVYMYVYVYIYIYTYIHTYIHILHTHTYTFI